MNKRLSVEAMEAMKKELSAREIVQQYTSNEIELLATVESLFLSKDYYVATSDMLGTGWKKNVAPRKQKNKRNKRKSHSFFSGI